MFRHCRVAGSPVFLDYSIRYATTESFHILSRSLVMTQVPYHALLCSLSYSCPTVQCAAISNCSHCTVAPADVTCLSKQATTTLLSSCVHPAMSQLNPTRNVSSRSVSVLSWNLRVGVPGKEHVVTRYQLHMFCTVD